MECERSAPFLHSVAVSGVVEDACGRVLVVRRRDNARWELPGGVVERGEGLQAALAREYVEETGLHVRVLHLTGVYKNVRRDIVTMVFVCQVLAGTPQVTEESGAFSWAEPARLSELLVEAHAARALDALTGTGVVVRHHDGVALVAAPDGA